MVDLIEEGFDVDIHDPGLAFQDKGLGGSYGVEVAPAWPKTVTVGAELGVPQLCQVLLDRLLDQSILRILGGRFGLEWSAACEDISPFVADPAVAELIGVSPGSALLRQACSAFAEDGSLVFYEDVYRTGSVSFNLSRQGRSPKT